MHLTTSRSTSCAHLRVTKAVRMRQCVAQSAPVRRSLGCFQVALDATLGVVLHHVFEDLFPGERNLSRVTICEWGPCACVRHRADIEKASFFTRTKTVRHSLGDMRCSSDPDSHVPVFCNTTPSHNEGSHCRKQHDKCERVLSEHDMSFCTLRPSRHHTTRLQKSMAGTSLRRGHSR